MATASTPPELSAQRSERQVSFQASSAVTNLPQGPAGQQQGSRPSSTSDRENNTPPQKDGGGPVKNGIDSTSNNSTSRNLSTSKRSAATIFPSTTSTSDAALSESSRDYSASFPMLYSFNRSLDDALLAEVLMIVKGEAFVPTSHFTDWELIPENNMILNISDHALKLIGGMLCVDQEFIFEEMPFVQTACKEVRCRLDLLSDAPEGVKEITTLGGGTEEPEGGSSSLSLTSQKQSNATKNNSNSGSGAHLDALRISFSFTEFQGLVDSWVVQAFQLIRKDGPKGKHFTRAFIPFDADQTIMGGGQGGIGGKGKGSPGQQQGGASVRNPVFGEEKLRLKNPTLFRWCLERDPFELGTASVIIRDLLQYYKYSFFTLRMVNSLTNSVKKLQKFLRNCYRAKHRILEELVEEWTNRENQTYEILAKQQEENLLATDEVDIVVREALLKRGKTSYLQKCDIINSFWDQRRKDFHVHCERLGQAAGFVVGKPFSWHIPVDQLMNAAHRKIIDRLTSGEESLFLNSRIQKLTAQVPVSLKGPKFLPKDMKWLNFEGKKKKEGSKSKLR